MKSIFLHGLDYSSSGHQARQLSALELFTPDSRRSLEERMGQLEPFLKGDDCWVLLLETRKIAIHGARQGGPAHPGHIFHQDVAASYKKPTIR